MAFNVNMKRPRQEADNILSDKSELGRKELVGDSADSGCTESQKRTHPLAGEDEGGDQAASKRKKNDNGSTVNVDVTTKKSHKWRERDRKNVRHRRPSRNDLSRETEDGRGVGTPDELTPKAPRLPKRQCALMIGFCGSGCNGMQIQPNVRTIEGVLFGALVKAGAVSQDNADDPTKVNLGRAARTDAGVHAAGNVVSIKIIMAVPGTADMVSRINEELPPEIRLWGFVRVQNSFNARLSCDSRKYTYFFPTYLLIPPKPGSGLDRNLQKSATSSPTLPVTSLHPFWADGDAALSSKKDDLIRKRQWRISPEQVKLLRETVTNFEGTHNFHNFTVGRDFGDRSNQRHMKKIEVSDPVVHGNTEWISVMFHGQSFMLHQIRKMMAILVLSCRTSTPQQIIEELYGPRVVFVPKMPSLGLMLECPIFDSYNNKVAGINEKLELSHQEYRPPIDFDLYRDKIDKFKQEFIYNQMRAIEDQNAIFDAWIQSVDSYAGNDLLYLNSRGIIPPAAVIKQGERRERPFKEKRRFDTTSFPRGIDTNTGKQEEGEEDEGEETPFDRQDLADMEG